MLMEPSSSVWRVCGVDLGVPCASRTRYYLGQHQSACLTVVELDEYLDIRGFFSGTRARLRQLT